MRVLLASGEIASYFFLVFCNFTPSFRSKTATFRQGADSVQETWKVESCDRVCVRSDDVRVEKMGRGIKTSDRFCQRIFVNLQRKDNKTPFLMI